MRAVDGAECLGDGVYRLPLHKPPGLRLPAVRTVPLARRTSVPLDARTRQRLGGDAPDETFELLLECGDKAESTAVEAMLMCSSSSTPPRALRQ